jgi:pSer/pThr/pTyr-binding forkhead associated (FHA) protein
MAYGRLDIYWPDGPIESYQLSKPSVAIGRSTGNDIVLDTNAVSRYHITVARKDNQVVLEDLDSANGTYIDGDRVKAREPYPLRGGEEIQIGEIRLIFQPEQMDVETKPIPQSESQVTRRIEIIQPTFRIELDPPPIAVTPGAHVQASLSISNTGSDVERYFVEIEGVPKDWVRLDRAEIELDPEQRTTVMISFKPLRRSESAPGDYTVTVRVRAKGLPTQPIEAHMPLHVLTFSGFGIMMSTPRIEINTPFELYIHNQGSGPLALSLSGASPGDALAFDMQPLRVTLTPGERKVIRGTVRPKRSALVGQPRELRFDILARAQDASGFLAAVEGTLIERPALPIWVPTVALALLAILLIGAIALGLVALTTPRKPVITAFAASTTQMLEGETVTLTWAVNDASTVTLQLDGATVQFDPKTGRLEQVMPSAGSHVFTLIARNGNEAVQREVALTVGRALNIELFTVTPNPVLRYIRQDVVIKWQIAGAESVRFQGIEGLTGKPDDAPYPPSGELKLSGTPRDSLALSLLATGIGGKQLSQSIQVQIENPVCTTSVDVEVRGGPGTVYPTTKTLTANTQVTPDGRDASGEWIHLAPTPDLQAWLPVNAVTCTGFTPLELTLINAVPPTPTATITPQPTATPVTPTSPPTATTTPTNTVVVTPTQAGEVIRRVARVM